MSGWRIAQLRPEEVDSVSALLASQSGLSVDLVERLRTRISEGVGNLPMSVADWLAWTVAWLQEDSAARTALLQDVRSAALGACGKNKKGELTPEVLGLLLPGLLGWIDGEPLAAIETRLGGESDSDKDSKRVCPRARELVTKVIPRGFAFIMGLITHVVKVVDPFEAQEDLRKDVIECLGTAVRKGFNTPEMIGFSEKLPKSSSRVQVHMAWEGSRAE